MAFSHEILLEAWAQAKGRCECQREGHGHDGHCGKALLWTMQGADAGAGWFAVRRTSWGTDVLANCVILCAACGTLQPVRVH
jgi:hypothetical protein